MISHVTNEAVWEPLPPRQVNGTWHVSSQAIALDSPCNETLFCGTRGPGKTDTQLMYFAKHVGLGYGWYWNGVILDTQYSALTEIFERAVHWFRQIWGDEITVKSAKGDQEIKWSTGEKLIFRIAGKEKDYWNVAHGQQFTFIGWNELTKQKDAKLYDMFMSANRSSWDREKDAPETDLPQIPLVVFSTTNSYGIGFRWVKKRFIDPAPYGVPVEVTRKVFSPKLQKHIEVTRSQVAIFGSYKENIYLDPIYVAWLESQTNPNLRKSWLEGSWEISGGGLFDDLWTKRIHEKPRFVVPSSWRIDRCFDWGSSEPFSIIWFAVADGTEATLLDGRIFAPKKGSIIQIHEWYGAKDIDENVGLQLSVKAISDGIKAREINMMAAGWITTQPFAGPADNQIRNVQEVDTTTIETKFKEQGIKWLKSDKAPGTRIIGATIFRELLEGSLTGVGPGFYVMDNCRPTIAIVPNLPRDEEKLDDTDDRAIDHPWDVIRYKVLAAIGRTARTAPIRIPV